MADAASSLRVEVEVVVPATQERVFAALTGEIGAWWAFPFHAPSEVRLEAWVGGRFYEAWSGGELDYAMVTRIQPGVLLALSGPMGLTGRVDGSIVFILVGETGGTRLILTHAAAGELPSDAEARYLEGWRLLLEDRLPAFLQRKTGTT